MTLNDFTLQKTIAENDIGRISSGIITKTDEAVFLITHFQYTSMRRATRHAMQEHLHHIIDQFQQDDMHYAVIKQHDGLPLTQYLSNEHYDLDSRIYICYELLKVIRKYDVFPDTIKYQLIQLPQWEVVEDVLMLKEAILFDEQTPYTFKDVLKQIASLMELIIQPTLEPHVQFIENLVLGNHHYSQLDVLISDFKAIFIYEKPEAINAIPREFNLIFSEHMPSDETFSHQPIAKPQTKPQAKPQVKTQVKQQIESQTEPQTEWRDNTQALYVTNEDVSEKKPIHVSRKRDLNDTIFIEENEAFLSELFGPEVKPPVIKEADSPTETSIGKAENEVEAIELAQDSISENIKALESKLIKTDTDTMRFQSAPVPYVPETLPPFCDLAEAEDPFYPEMSSEDDFIGPPETITRSDRLEDEIYAHDVPPKASEHTDENPLSGKAETLENPLNIHTQKTSVLPINDKTKNDTVYEDTVAVKSIDKERKHYIFPIIATLAVLVLIILGSKMLFFKPDILEASYQIESLADNRVAFINTSTSSHKIDVSEWTIYYEDHLVQQFVTENLYPVFDTEGDYTIELRIKDRDGNWSAVYRKVFPYYEHPATEGATLENIEEKNTTNK